MPNEPGQAARLIRALWAIGIDGTLSVPGEVAAAAAADGVDINSDDDLLWWVAVKLDRTAAARIFLAPAEIQGLDFEPAGRPVQRLRQPDKQAPGPELG